MKLLFNEIFLQHDTGMHPESRQRLDAFSDLSNSTIPDAAHLLPLVHDPNYIERVERACVDSQSLDADTRTSPRSFEVAQACVGMALRAMEERNFAIVRPPGHHAYPDKATGFCLFSTIGIIAKKLAAEGQRVLIIDFDGHLGDGTEAIFYDDKQVLFWSIHQFPAFPGNGTIDELGTGDGMGYTINVPLPPGAGDDLFLKAFEDFLPIAEQFKPDVVAISAGFDAHLYDPLLQLNATGNSFHRIGQILRERFDNVFAVLEGGYSVKYMPRSVLNFVAGMNGEDMPFPEQRTSSTRHVWEVFDMDYHQLFSNLSDYWKI